MMHKGTVKLFKSVAFFEQYKVLRFTMQID